MPQSAPLTVLRLDSRTADFQTQLRQRLHWSSAQDDDIEERVRGILADVQARGDAAVLEYTARFDGLSADSMQALELLPAELKAAYDGLPDAQRDALLALGCSQFQGYLFGRPAPLAKPALT